MGFPLYLAMTASEMANSSSLPEKCAWMACHFSAWGEGITNLPGALPPGSMLILNDRMPCSGHSPGLVVRQLADCIEKNDCGSVLLDFQRPKDPESAAMVKALVQALDCPAAVTENYAEDLPCSVFLAPGPLHSPLEEYLSVWRGREIWMEAALCQEAITVSKDGASYSQQFPPEGLENGFFDSELQCHYRSYVSENAVRFTLFDTRESLMKKLAFAQTLGVSRAVGLYQELGVPYKKPPII